MGHPLRSAVQAAVIAALTALLACEPVFAATSSASVTAPPTATAQLTGDARILHALDRLTFGPRPGEVEAVRKLGLDRWFEQQLHPATIDDHALEQRLSEFPAMHLSQAELLERFPDQQNLKAMARTNAGLPTDPDERAIYRDGIAFAREREAQKAGKDAKAGAEPAGMKAAADNYGFAEANTAPRMAQSEVDAILALPPAQRFVRVRELAPDELRSLRKSLAPDELAQLVAGLSPAQKETLAALGGPQKVVGAELLEQRVERDVESNRQLEAVMTDFWLNHFNVYLRKNQIEPYLLVSYERDTVRPHALGRFEDLLRATASSSAMLVYLDNAQSIGPHSEAAERAGRLPAQAGETAKQKAAKDRGLNENYARELMELHTIGVRCEVSKDHTPSDPTCGGGYTQTDVTEVARVLTGWTVARPNEGSAAVYIDRRHEPGDKHVLGHTIRSGGEREGVELLHLLATDPATAQFVCTKLAVRFVSDAPPPDALVSRMTAAWRASDGDISTVLRAMFHAPEFWAAGTERSKVKTPIEFVASAARATGAEVSSALPLVQALNRLGMPVYGMPTPNGYSWTAESWVSTGALVSRMNFALLLAGNRLPGVNVDWSPLSVNHSSASLRPVELTERSDAGSRPLTAEARSLELALLGRPASPRTEQAVLAQVDASELTQRAEQDFLGDSASHAPGTVAPQADADPQIAVMAGLLLGSPEFQRR